MKDRFGREAGKAAREANDEVEVTPEMIEVGVAELCKWDSYFETDEGGVRKIYVAMCRARPAASICEAD